MSNDESKSREELLIDYLENEVEPTLKKDLDLVLESSELDRRRLWSLRSTRKAVSLSAGEAKIDDRKMASLHDAIMANLDKKLEDNIVVLPARKRFVPVAAAVVVFILGSIVVWNMRRSGELGRSNSTVIAGDMFISTSASDLDAFSDSLINDKSDSDFFMDVAASKIDELPQNEAAAIFE